MSYKCIICRSDFDPQNTKPEHILLNALGGKKTTRKAICSDCNEKAGGTIDSEMSEAVAFVRNFCSWRSGDGDDAPTLIAVETTDGQKVNLLPGGVPDDRKVEFKVTEKDGVKKFEGGVSTYGRLVAMLPHIARQLGISEEIVLRELTKNGLKVQVKRPPTLNIQMSFGGELQIASAAKMALVLWSELIGGDQLQSSEYDSVANNLKALVNKGKIAKWYITPNAQVPTGLNLPSNRNWGEFCTVLHAFSDGEGNVRGWLRLYNTINYFADLAVDSRHKNRSITVFSNPDSLEWEILNDFDIGVGHNFFVNPIPNPDELKAAMIRLGRYATSKQQLANQNKVAGEAVAEGFPIEGGAVTQEHWAEVSRRVAEAMVAQQLDQNYEKVIPKELAEKMIAEIKENRKNGK